MRPSARWLATLCLALAWGGWAQAQSAYRWVDQEGKVHYGDRPPPAKSVRELEERKLSAPAADPGLPYGIRQAAANYPVTLYVNSGCGAPCEEGRGHLRKRGVPFAEKLVATAEEIETLKKLLGGAEPTVPVLQVGARVYKGWQEGGWDGLLDAAGYPKPGVR